MGAANGKEGKWSWVNDSFKVQYSNWAPGEPSGGTNQCAQIWYRSNYTWDDTHCNRLGKGYICERTQVSKKHLLSLLSLVFILV